MVNVFRRFGVDESGSLYDKPPISVVVMTFDDGTHNRLQEKKRGHAHRTATPYGVYRYVVLTDEMLEASRAIYPGPQNAIERSWNGKYHEFSLRKDAVVRLMEEFEFDPDTDRVFIDSFCRSVHLRNQIIGTYERATGIPLKTNSVKCMHSGRGRTDPAIMSADEIAYRLHDKYDEFPDFKVDFTYEDLTRFNLTRHEKRTMTTLPYPVFSAA